MVWKRRGFVLAAFASLGLSAAPPALAQQACGSAPAGPSRDWPAPLNRILSIQARNVSLRDGLDRVAASARFRLSYSAELLPLDRRVCLSSDSIVAGEALAALLAGTGIEAVTTASDQVVLTPAHPSTDTMSAPAPGVQTLERVVVTGSAMGDSQRSLSVALDVIDGKKLAERGSNNFSSSLDGSVPGLWVWEQSPSSLLARYGSIRGASSFTVSYPKVYIDGIEVANPLLMTDLNPAAVDHVEVIRGPQGAALYGADAISGVVNIVTRHEGTQAGDERTSVVTAAGLSQSSYAAKSVLAQNHALTWRGGSSMRSGSIAVNATTLGGYVPEAYSRDLKLNGAFRAVTSAASFTGTARFYGKQAAVGENPLLSPYIASAAQASTRRTGGALRSEERDAVTAPAIPDSLPESIHEYTLGGTATLFTSGRWTPAFTAGVDGYRLSNVPNDLVPISSSIDTALHAAGGGADRGTLRASVVGKFDLADSSSLTVTLAAEHSALREIQDSSVIVNLTGTSVPAAVSSTVNWRTNTGLIAQGNLALNETIYLTAGLRLEQNDGFTTIPTTALLPMLGAAIVRDAGGATLKVRTAYGRGIRPVQTPIRTIELHDMRRNVAGPDLDPEEQSGIEVGADLLFGRRFGLHATRFDQTAFGLIQAVAIPRDTEPYGGGPGPDRPRLAYVLQNVGEIANSGWELESSASLGPLSVAGALSLVDSRVQRIARGYTGDLQLGDRMLNVPARTMGASVSWNQTRWFATVTMSRASDWIGYDRLRLAQDFASTTHTEQDLTGSRLRSYWMSYGGVTRLRATVSRTLLSNIALTVTGDNLTNAQSGEPDNITVLPGRTLMIGLSAKIR